METNVALSDERERIGRIVDEAGIETVRVGGVDIDGVWRGKQVPVGRFLEHGWRDGDHLCNAIFAISVAEGLVPGVTYTGFDTGFPELHVVPDLTTFAPVPGRPGTASVMCDFCELDGSPIDLAPRQVLKRVIDRLGEQGLVPKVGYELEFLMFGEAWDSAQAKGFNGLPPLYPELRTYSFSGLGRLDPIVGDIVRQLVAAGLPIEGITTEYSPGQFEINLAAGDALRVADDVVRFKAAVREIAESHGVVATFMAKYDADLSGSSAHLHQSLWRADGHSAFAPGPDDDGLSATGRRYLAGLLASMPDITAVVCPTVNSYKRKTAWTFAPTTATWAVDNRTTGLRVVTGAPSATRIEHRLPGADANPYLVIAACLAGGLYGIEHELDPPAPVAGNGYELSPEEAPPLPETLEEAVGRLDESKIARELLGEAFVDHFVLTRQAEVAAWRTAVTDWERKRYFEVI